MSFKIGVHASLLIHVSAYCCDLLIRLHHIPMVKTIVFVSIIIILLFSSHPKFIGQTRNLYRCGPKNTDPVSVTLTYFSRSQTHFCAKNPKLQIHITSSFMIGF